MKLRKILIKKAIFTFFVFFSLSAFASSIASGIALDNYKMLYEKMVLIENKSALKPTVKENNNKSYIVKEFNRVIGIFDFSGSLIYTIDVYIETLPEKDREMLKEGIYADSYEELLEIIEDYNS